MQKNISQLAEASTDLTFSLSNPKEYIFIFFGMLGFLILKFLSWIMPKAAKVFYRGLKITLVEALIQSEKETQYQLSGIIKEFSDYKAKKHSLEGENAYLKEAIISRNEEQLEVIRKVYSQKLNTNDRN